jgi:OOP family OmpA-OmpF porin
MVIDRIISGAFLLALLLSTSLHAQQVQWSSHIAGFSSQGSTRAYSAKDVLGEPNKLPATGDCGCAWSPSKRKPLAKKVESKGSNTEYIRVGFAKPQKIKQVIIAANHYVDAVDQVYLYDYQNREELVYTRNTEDRSTTNGKILNIIFDKTAYKVKNVKVVLNLDAVPGNPQLDAIGVSSSQNPIEVEIAVSKKFKTFGKPQDLGPSVNSKYSELMPRFTPDGQRLYFVRKDHPENFGGFMNDDIWFSDVIDKKLQPATRMIEPLNSAYHNYVCGVSTDNIVTLANQYYFDGTAAPGLSQTFKMNSSDQWVFPLNLEITDLFTGGLYAEYYIDPERTVLLMAIEPVDAKGGKDIYISFSDDKVKWSKPKNLGEVINTAGMEMAPFLSADKKMLFFSSNGHRGYGDQDIFVSRRSGSDWFDWSSPENIGPNVNSANWESHFIIDPIGDYGYYAKAEDIFGNPDILRISLKEKDSQDKQEEFAEIELELANEEVESEPPYPFEEKLLLFGYVRDAITRSYVPSSLEFIRKDTPDKRINIPTRNAQYQLKLEDQVDFDVVVNAPGYPETVFTVRIEELRNGVRRKDFEIYPQGYEPPPPPEFNLEPGALVRLQNVFFDINSSVIKEESFPELNRFLAAAKNHPNIQISIEGHTNSNCAKNYCEKLSNTRARRVAQYLIKGGIEVRNVTWVGYGKNKPLADNNSPEGREQNQRVELRIN